MNTSLNIKSVEQSSGRKLQKTITDVNPNADGTALKTWAQGLNNLTTNRYVGTTKINIDNLLEEDTGGGGSGAVNPLPAPNIVITYAKSNAVTAHSCTFTNAATTVSLGVIDWSLLAVVTDADGELNVTSTPVNSATRVSTGVATDDKSLANIGITPDPLPAAITSMQNPVWRILYISIPDSSDPTCFGDFTFVLNATETHSSATVTLNITGIQN